YESHLYQEMLCCFQIMSFKMMKKKKKITKMKMKFK
ncbi:MAG: hypothetical protein EZS28_050066, partial [Streblomastix strix]